MNVTLELRRQDALGKEQHSKNEVQKEVFVVAKNLPFLMEVGSSLSLHDVKLYARLYYDNDYVLDFSELKPVDFVNQEPLKYRTFVSDQGDKATVELRIFVLSSQHEDSLFRVKIGMVDISSNTTYEITSAPIKCLSKPSLVNKKPKIGGRKASSPAKEKSANGDESGSSDTSPVFPTMRSIASPNNDPVLSALARLEQQQRDQQRLIEKLIADKQQPASWSLPVAIPDPDGNDFEMQFQKLLALFNKIPAETRAAKMRKVICAGNTDASEFVNCLSETTAWNCEFLESTHKSDLQLDQLYTDLMIMPQ